MKKFLQKLMASMMIFILVLSFTGCDKNEEDSSVEESEEVEETEQNQEDTNTDEDDTDEVSQDQRVVAGTVAVSYILDALDYENVVGLPESTYSMPERYNEATNIGTPMKPDAEIVKSLEPDLFISVSSLEESNKPAMDNLGIESLFINLSDYDNILQSVKEIAEVLNLPSEGDKVVASIEEEANDAIAKAEGLESPKVLFIFGTPKSVMVGNEDSYVGSLMKMLQINNIAADAPEEYTPLSLENIVEENPDIVLVMNHVNPEESKKMMQAEFDRNPAWSNMKAYQNDKIIYLDNDIYSVTGNIRVGEALEKLVEMVYEK
ncbi:MAG: ABC transporter substrate-binding protein [Tissierellia bacterium]|nr:ABC transporter substrate-binding protein [Tissierellia bacterium]